MCGYIFTSSEVCGTLFLYVFIVNSLPVLQPISWCQMRPFIASTRNGKKKRKHRRRCNTAAKSKPAAADVCTSHACIPACMEDRMNSPFKSSNIWIWT